MGLVVRFVDEQTGPLARWISFSNDSRRLSRAIALRRDLIVAGQNCASRIECCESHGVPGIRKSDA